MEAKSILTNYFEKHSSFSPGEIAIISSYFQPKSLKKEEILFEKGMRFSKIVFVAKGILRSFIHNDNGEEIVKTFISPSNFFAEIDSFDREIPCSFNVSAITPCKLLTLTKTDAQKLAMQVKDWEIAMKNEALKAMNSMVRKQEFLSIGDAADKYRHFVEQYPELARELPLKYIASYLQITQSSLSRIRRQGW